MKVDELYPNNDLKQSVVFPLYLCSKELTRKYNNYLSKYDITYTQYLVLMYFYHEKESNLKRIGKVMMLDSSTLTPLLKKMENKKLIERKKSSVDERNLVITITDKGNEVANDLKKLLYEINNQLNLSNKEIELLHNISFKIIKTLREEK